MLVPVIEGLSHDESRNKFRRRNMSKTIFASLVVLGCTGLLLAASKTAARPQTPSAPANLNAAAPDEDDDEETQEITMDKVPEAARAAILAAAGNNAIDSVYAEQEMGATLYEAAWQSAGHLHEVVVMADGSVVEHEAEMALVDSPAAIQATVAATMANATQIKVTRREVVVYEVEATVNGEGVEALLGATGLPVEIEVQGDHGDDDDEHAGAGDDDDDEHAGAGDDDDDEHGGDDDDDDDDDGVQAA
jgi:hypothetical protein